MLVEGRSPSDPRYRQAMEIYNGSVDHLIRAAMTRGHIQPQEGEVISFKFHGREEKLRIVLKDSPWKSSDVHKILLASDFEVSGLDQEFNQYGLGVPLIGVREASDKLKDRAPQERFYPTEMAFPLTAFLVPNSRLLDPNVDIEKTRVCTLWLIDPVQQRTVGIGENKLALEIDLTTPLAYMWSRTDLDRFRWTGLLRPEKGLDRANLLLLRPYEPGKIPVVMVHGLISTPLAWIPMINGLQRKPEIQKHYQFLLYMYPTGVPVPIAAASLREDLIQAKQMYDPDGRDPAFDRMVLLGHSMGGLLSHMMVLDSADKLWRLYSDRSFDNEIIGPREVIEELRQYLFFKPLPFVSRVVFLATPHRGSDMSHGVIGRVGTSLISDPDNIHKLLARLVKENQDAFDTQKVPPVPDEHRDARHQFADPQGPGAHAAEPTGRVPLDHRVDPRDRRGRFHRRRGPLSQLPLRRRRLGENGALRPRGPEASSGDQGGRADPPGAHRRNTRRPTGASAQDRRTDPAGAAGDGALTEAMGRADGPPPW